MLARLLRVGDAVVATAISVAVGAASVASEVFGVLVGHLAAKRRGTPLGGTEDHWADGGCLSRWNTGLALSAIVTQVGSTLQIVGSEGADDVTVEVGPATINVWGPGVWASPTPTAAINRVEIGIRAGPTRSN